MDKILDLMKELNDAKVELEELENEESCNFEDILDHILTIKELEKQLEIARLKENE